LPFAITAAGFLLSDRSHSQVSASAQGSPQGSAQDSPQGNQAAPSADGRTLHLTLATGAAFRLQAERLRAACRCAHCRRAQIDGVFPSEFTAITITQVAPIGHYAVNLEFSDGHARGIYPWSYLAELGADWPA
jgi:DUF971 family protein